MENNNKTNILLGSILVVLIFIAYQLVNANESLGNLIQK